MWSNSKFTAEDHQKIRDVRSFSPSWEKEKEREREREKEREGEGERGRERGREKDEKRKRKREERKQREKGERERLSKPTLYSERISSYARALNFRQGTRFRWNPHQPWIFSLGCLLTHPEQESQAIDEDLPARPLGPSSCGLLPLAPGPGTQ